MGAEGTTFATCRVATRTAGPRGALVVTAAFVCLSLARGQESQPAAPLLPPGLDFRGQTALDVVHVESGNTLVVRREGRLEPVRLIGTYVPSSGPHADAARDYVARLLGGEAIYLRYEANWPLRDRDGRQWVYAFRAPEGQFVNLELIRMGYARLSVVDRFEYENLFRAYERLAENSEKGLWAPPVAEPAATSQPMTRAEPSAAAPKPSPAQTPTDDAKDPLVYVTTSGEKYHRSDCASVRGGSQAMKLSAAKAAGKTACKRCRPPE